jgi:hypothetical protein
LAPGLLSSSNFFSFFRPISKVKVKTGHCEWGGGVGRNYYSTCKPLFFLTFNSFFLQRFFFNVATNHFAEMRLKKMLFRYGNAAADQEEPFHRSY